MNQMLENLREESIPALTKWENEPKAKDFKQDYEDALSAHNAQVSKIDAWLDNYHVRGKAEIKKIKGRSTMVPKLIRKQAEWRYAPLSEPFLNNESMFQVLPVTFEDKAAAQQNELVLNNQFSTKIDRVQFIDDYVRSAVDEGTAIVRVGWVFEEEEQEVEEPVLGMVPITDPAEAEQAIMQGFPPFKEGVIGTRMVKKMVTTKNYPTVECCHYNDVVVDPTCRGNFDKANFIIYRFETNLSDLEKAGIYKNLEYINVENNSILSEPDTYNVDRSFNFKDKPRKKFTAYEYWGYWDIDGSGKTKPIVATWVGSTLIRLEESPFPDGKLPFVIVPYLPVRWSVYGEPDGSLLEDNQKITGAVTRGMIDAMGRSANGQMGVRLDALDVTNRRKFEAGMDYEFNAHVHPSEAFFMHTYPEIPQSAQFMLQLQNNEAESLTGVKAFSTGGITGDAYGETATGARNALDAASKRELAILRRLAEGMRKIGRKIIAMNALFLSEEEVIRITNEEFVTVKRDDLAGNLDLKLDISTAETDNAKAQELAFMLQTMGNSMPPEMSQIILSDIARLRNMPDLAKQIKEYQPQPDPIAQEKAQLEVEYLKAAIEKERAATQELMATAEYDMARANSETEKARLTGSEADLRDLDFVEQESGVKQERDLERQGAQAEANMRRDLALKDMDSVMQREAQQARQRESVAKEAAKAAFNPKPLKPATAAKKSRST